MEPLAGVQQVGAAASCRPGQALPGCRTSRPRCRPTHALLLLPAPLAAHMDVMAKSMRRLTSVMFCRPTQATQERAS